MAPLNINQVRKLTISILEDISGTEYACTSLSRILGGSASFTFRGALQSPLVSPDGATIYSIIVKKATDFAAINGDFALDCRRSKYEDAMLRALLFADFVTVNDTMPVRTPRTLFYMPIQQIQVIEDLQPAADLAGILRSRADDISQRDFTAIGLALGSWLHSFHGWATDPKQAELNHIMSENGASRDLKRRTTYDTIVDIAEGFPAIVKEHVDVLREVQSGAMLDHKQWLMNDARYAEAPSHGLVHGDFWTGNILFNAVPQPQLHVIDFEFAHFGHRAMDLGQMIGDLLEKRYMSDADPSARSGCETVLTAFAKGYNAIDEDLAYRAVIHAGVHIVNWCARHPDTELRGKVEGLLQEAVAYIVRAWKKDKAWLDRSILGCLFHTTE